MQNKGTGPDSTALTGPASPKRRKGLFRRFARDRDGTTAIEFAILAIPFMMVTFATVETFVAFTGEQLLANATETLARKIRTGQITFGINPATDMTKTQFRQAFCDEISVMMTCSSTEAATASRLYVDVRSFTDFSKIPVAVPRIGSADNSDLDTSGFSFAPGGPRSINIVRAYYRWEVITDLVRPYITNLRPAGSSMPKDFLMVATSAFINENY